MPNKIGFLFLIGLLLACSPSANQLKAPVYSWSHGNDLCSLNRYVDANRQVWSEEGCESSSSGLKFLGIISEQKYTAIQSAFSALPVPQATCQSASFHIFTLTAANKTRTEWTACGSGDSYFDLSGLAEPYLGLAQQFVGLGGQ